MVKEKESLVAEELATVQRDINCKHKDLHSASAVKWSKITDVESPICTDGPRENIDSDLGVDTGGSSGDTPGDVPGESPGMDGDAASSEDRIP